MMDVIRAQAGEAVGLPNIRQPNLKSRVYELLLNMIIDGKYKDNDMLPPERILCEELGVSRTVIREAIKSLESRGVLQVIHGKGIMVAPATSGDISSAFILYLRRQHREVSMRDLLELRGSVETANVMSASLRAEEADLRGLRELLDRMEKSVADVERYVVADLDFHLKLAYAAHNILFITVLESLLIPLRQSFEETFEVHENELTFLEHSKIYTCIAARDPDGARATMLGHLQHTERMLKGRGKL